MITDDEVVTLTLSQDEIALLTASYWLATILATTGPDDARAADLHRHFVEMYNSNRTLRVHLGDKLVGALGVSRDGEEM